MATTQTRIHPELAGQRQYVNNLGDSDDHFALVAAEAFVRGIRDIGYKNTATALDELIDNSIQAGSTKIAIAFGYGKASDTKPDRLVVIDNGHGMDPIMVRAAMMWGGTHRENNRLGLGRYGYGLPSSCVSQGKCFTVFSTPAGGVLHKVSLDLDDLTEGRYYDEQNKVVIPLPQEAELPAWVEEHRAVVFGADSSWFGTAVVIEKLDRLTWMTTNALERNLLEHIGVTYRNYLRGVAIFINNSKVAPVDPLFTTEGFRFYDIDEDRAEPLPPRVFTVGDRDNRKEMGTVSLRYSYLPPRFAAVNKSRKATTKNRNGRFGIMNDHNGIIVLREGRQIDVVTKCPWTRFQNNDSFWMAEVDFPATLDEEFSITTSKQQVVLSERIWGVLREQGMMRVIEDLRGRYRQDDRKASADEEEDHEKQRASEKVMEDANKFKTKKPAGDIATRQEEADKHLNEEAERRANQQNRPLEQIRGELVAETQGQPYKVDFESIPGSAFYRPEQMGGQSILWINTSHQFYSDVYMGPESTPRLRAGVELLLFVLGEGELDASDEDRRLFYKTERQAQWSQRLGVVLEVLNRQSNVDDSKAIDEELEVTADGDWNTTDEVIG